MSLDNYHSTNNNHIDKSQHPTKSNSSTHQKEKMDEDTFNSIRALHNAAFHFDHEGVENDYQEVSGHYELLGSYFDALSIRSNNDHLDDNSTIQSSSSCIVGKNGVVITAIVLMAIYPLILSSRRFKSLTKRGKVDVVR